MSNRICFEPCEFTNTRSGESSKGFRAFDDYHIPTNYNRESIPDDDLEFLALIVKQKGEGNFDLDELLDWIEEQEQGIYIGDTWHEWEEIKHLWKADPDEGEPR